MSLETEIDLRNQTYWDWGIRTIIVCSDVTIERVKSIVVTTYDGGDLHM